MKGISWESCGELASPGLQPKLVPAQQVKHEEPEDIEDEMENAFYKSKIYHGIIHKGGAVTGEATIWWSPT